MKYIFLPFLVLFFFGCSTKKLPLEGYEGTLVYPDESVKKVQNSDEILALFVQNCTTKKAQKLYGVLCQKARKTNNSTKFFQDNFTLYKVVDATKGESGLLTGYYEPLLEGSLEKKPPFVYPVYGVPKDLLEVDLSSVYPELKRYRLRGRVVGNKVVPYYARGEKKILDAEVLAYVKSEVALFFLEVQGSGRILLEDGSVLYLGYANQNGHKYTSIGRYMIQKGYVPKDGLSLGAIEEYLQKNPQKTDEVLHQNASMVFFEKRKTPATGALGLELKAFKSVAVDATKIPLGAMMYYKTDTKEHNSGVVFAQDTGGAIRGSVRMDLFCGFGGEALHTAGGLQNPLEVWIYLPKEKDE